MRVTREKAAENRARIVETASRSTLRLVSFGIFCTCSAGSSELPRGSVVEAPRRRTGDIMSPEKVTRSSSKSKRNQQLMVFLDTSRCGRLDWRKFA